MGKAPISVPDKGRIQGKLYFNPAAFLGYPGLVPTKAEECLL